MRILFANHTGDWSGAEVALMRLIAGLSGDHEIAVACPPNGRVAATMDAAGIPRLTLPATDVSLRPHLVRTPAGVAQIGRAGLALRIAAARHDADVIHANSLRAGLTGAVAAQLRCPPIVVQVHEHLPHSLLANATRIAVARTATAVVGVTAYTTANFNEGLATPIAEHVYISIDHERFNPERVVPADLRAELRLPDDAKLIAQIAQITPWKGQETAIRMLARIRRARSDVHLVLVGEVAFNRKSTRFDNARYLRDLHALVDSLDLSACVHFVGQRTDVPAVLAAVDLTVLPSWNEPFGTVAAESMAMGTPAMVGAIGGVPEYVPQDESDLVLPPRQPDVWAEAALALLSDPARLVSMGARVRAAVAGFTDERYADTMLAVYERAVERKPPVRLTRAPPRKASPAASPRVWPDERLARLLLAHDPLRILLVEYTSVLGGGQRSLLELLEVLREEAELRVACPEGPLAHEARALGVNVSTIASSQLSFKFDARQTPRELRAFAASAAEIRREIDTFRPQILHANSIRAGLACALAVPGGRVPLVIHCRDVLPNDLPGKVVREAVVRRATRVIAVSGYVAERMAGPQWEARGVRVVDNAVNLQRYDPGRIDAASVRAELGIESGPVLAVIGQLTSWKRQDHAVRVLERVRRDHPGAQLLIVGEAKFVSAATRLDNQSYERELHELVVRTGQEHCVRFLGERADPERILAITDVLLAPSWEEPFGRTIIEALAMNVPIVATDLAGPAEILRGRAEGRLLAAADLDAWVAAVGELFTRERLASGRAFAAGRFTPEAHANAIRTVYAQAIEHAVPTPV